MEALWDDLSFDVPDDIADRFAAIQGSINLYHALGGGADEPEERVAEEPAKSKKNVNK